MIEIVPIERLNATDLNMYQCGTEKCKPGHYFGPAVRDYFLIHYIFDGKGIYQVGDTTSFLSYNDMLSPPVIILYS
jgi:hypothetical protein